MHPESTFELSISCLGNQDKSADTKERLKEWLSENGEPSFVEGVVDGLDLDFDYENEGRDYYGDLGGDVVPLLVYKYDEDYLKALQSQLEGKFGSDISAEISKLETSNWMEGWKESFKPFSTESFYVYPPWDADNLPQEKLPIVVEPGMAFGTGQHATTQLCLREIEKQDFRSLRSALDVGTGTGILSIALKSLKCSHVFATDIDADAVIACKENAAMNGQTFDVHQMSVPEDGEYDIVVANILFVVIQRIFDSLVARIKDDGLLLISGVLAEEAHEMNALAQEYDLVLKNQQEHDGWVSLLYGKSSK